MWYTYFISIRPVTRCATLTIFFSSQQTTPYDMNLINLGTTWHLMCTDCTMKLQAESQLYVNAKNKMLSASFYTSWLVTVGRKSSHTVRWSPQFLKLSEICSRLSLACTVILTCLIVWQHCSTTTKGIAKLLSLVWESQKLHSVLLPLVTAIKTLFLN